MNFNQFGLFKEHESEVRSYCRQFSTLFERSSGSYMYNVEGNEYIDFLSAAGSLNFGHNNPIIKDSVIEYLKDNGIVCSLDLHTVAKRNFIAALQKNILEARSYEYKIQFTSPTGTSTVEAAIKLARKFTGRQNVVSFTNAFHGMSATSLSLTGNRHHRQKVSSCGVTILPYEGYFGKEIDSIDIFRKLLEDKSSGLDIPAAIICETVQGEGGINIASVEWLKKLENLAREFDIVLIIDEVQTGCGRCGNFFSFERAGITPDIVCLSKSIGGIGLPFALLLIDPKLDIWLVGEENGTFRGNNLAFVAATSMIEHYWSDNKFELDILNKEELVKRTLDNFHNQYPDKIKETRGLGLMHGIECVNSEDANQIVDTCFKNGLIMESCGSDGQVIKLMPALTISETTLKKGLSLIEGSMKSIFLESKNTAELIKA